MQNLKENERELIKLMNYFRKQADKLIKDGKLGPEHEEVRTACEKLINKLNLHAEQRAQIMQQRENLRGIVKDNAFCPKCSKNDMIKLTGTEKHEKGWQCNKYKCRRCNIEFIWQRPNNPWDMALFMENFINDLDTAMQNDAMEPQLKEQSASLIAEMQLNLDKLKPVINHVDKEYEEMQQRDTEMSKMIREFKSYLLIEKVKMDSWEEEGKEGN